MLPYLVIDYLFVHVVNELTSNSFRQEFAISEHMSHWNIHLDEK